MKDENFKYQMIAIQALDKKYGFCPSPQQVTLLESDGEGSYILFRVGDHEYRFEDGVITNSEDQKAFDAEVDSWFNANRTLNRDLADLREWMEEQGKRFQTKEEMLTTAYTAKQAEIETLNGRIRSLEEIAKDRLKEIERLEGKLGELSKNQPRKEADRLKKENEELVKTLHYRDLALDEAAKKREELETKNRQLCNDLAGERWTVRILKEKLESYERPAEKESEEK